MPVKRMSMYGILSLLVGIGSFASTFASGFGPFGPASPFGLSLIVLGFLAIPCGLVMLVRAGWPAVLGQKQGLLPPGTTPPCAAGLLRNRHSACNQAQTLRWRYRPVSA